MTTQTHDTGAVHVRDWQSDQAKPQNRGTSGPWTIADGLTAQPGTQRTVTWAVRMVLSCQRARATEAV